MSSQLNEAQIIPSRETELAQLRRRLFVGTLLYTTLVLAALTGCAALVLIQLVVWVRALPQGAERNWSKMMEDAPGIFYASIATGIVGLLLAVAGFALLWKLLKHEKLPSKRVVWGMTGTHVTFAVMAIGGLLSSGTAFGAALMLPMLLGFGLAFVPMELGLLAACLASLGLKQLRQRPSLIDSKNLPAAAAKYLNLFDADALEAGLTPLGDYSYLPHWKKYRRYWMAPNGAYFVDATWIGMGNPPLSAMGVSSATSDGHYFETVDQPRSAGAPEEDGQSLTHVTYLPGKPLAVLLEKHIEAVGEWVERAGCRPLEFAADELHAFTNYGIAAYMRETKNDSLWLGNPYFGQPLPPLPGRPWQPEEAVFS